MHTPPTVPTFPNFRKFSFADKEWYDDFYSKFLPSADLSFENLFVWCNLKHDLQISTLHGNLIFTFTDPFTDEGTLFFTVLGDQHPLETIRGIQDTLPKHQATMLPECFVAPILESCSGKITEDRDNWDYIYSIEKFVHMEGGDYLRLRTKIRRFLKSVEHQVEIFELDISVLENQVTLINAMHTWDLMFSLTENDPQRIENVVLDTLFSLQGPLRHHCYAFRFNGSLQGFVICHDVPQSGYVLVNHIKCSYKYKYMFDTMFFYVLDKSLEKGYKYANLEQDLGLEGLRDHKLSLRPQGYIKKYKLEASL